mgnify:CR=1 FL=1
MDPIGFSSDNSRELRVSRTTEKKRKRERERGERWRIEKEKRKGEKREKGAGEEPDKESSQRSFVTRLGGRTVAWYRELTVDFSVIAAYCGHIEQVEIKQHDGERHPVSLSLSLSLWLLHVRSKKGK